jgi:hypothetical protein
MLIKHRHKSVLTAAAVGAALLMTTPASPVFASNSEVVSRGICPQGTRSMLTLSHDDGQLEAEIELHANKAGQPWRIRFYNEGTREVSVTRIMGSADGGGSLSVSRLLTDHAGPSNITATAVNRATGERCVVQGSL